MHFFIAFIIHISVYSRRHIFDYFEKGDGVLGETIISILKMCVTAKINKLMNIQLYKWQTESRKRSESIERHHQG